MNYTIQINRKSQKALSEIPINYQDKIIEMIYALANNPYPHGCKKLSGREAWRIRIGNYRVIYEINESVLIILVVKIGHRKDIYKSG